MNGKLFSTNAIERNQEAIRLFEAGILEQSEIMRAIVDCVLLDGEKAEVGTLLWVLLASKKWDGKLGNTTISVLSICGNYEVRHHCMQLLSCIEDK